ncbi:hypothetical protein [Streptomyces scabiei]|uniref:hypothetical protein n=1 Tax=Streptomyces scabiei TaxID=1930 RepID=UPI001B3148DF|nr:MULTISPECIES: hypothetical protein [Streptomyces]MDX2794627.1 hypothetical protein [Streptomyces scabiei]MDX3822371.1 hypothetical protein [Streptomyces scabiei]
MTRDEYEAKKRRLEADIEDARKAFVRARGLYDQLCDEARDLRWQWRQQQDGSPQ